MFALVRGGRESLCSGEERERVVYALVRGRRE